MSNFTENVTISAKGKVEELHKNLRLTHLTKPPCPSCKFWDPIVLLGDRGEYAGYRLCHSEKQQGDFSCFQEKPVSSGS